MAEMLIAGIILGLSSGLAPGPLLVLVIAQTVRYGYKEGVKAALAPLLTDVPIIAVSLLVLSGISRNRAALGVLSIVGGLFLAYLAFETAGSRGVDGGVAAGTPRSLLKGTMINALNPHPYLFWATVGGPMTIKGYERGWAYALLFMAGFYVCLTGSKIALALVTDRYRDFLSGRSYGYVMRFLGLMLAVLALYLTKEGIRMLGP